MSLATVQTGNSAPLNVRASASTSSTLLGTIPNGTQVDVVRYDVTWATLLFNGTPAFVQHQYLTGTPTTNGAGLSTGNSAVCNGNNVNVRASAPSGSVVRQMNKGASATVLSYATHSNVVWYQIANNEWVSGVYLTPASESSGGGGGGGSGTFTSGHYVQVTSSTVNVRPTASTSQSYIGILRNGTKLICDGTSGSFVKVLWGGVTNGGIAYIHQDYMQDIGAAPVSKRDRAIAIGLSMDGAGYTDKAHLGLTATQWCVQYLSFLMRAAGCTLYPDFSTQAQVSGAISFFGSNYGARGSKTPVKGDWVMFSTPSETYAHVGLITTNPSGTQISTIEGNKSGSVGSRSISNYLSTSTNPYVLGFATPSW